MRSVAVSQDAAKAYGERAAIMLTVPLFTAL
jgi:hypothetical protein